jgi:hypothetical protein
MSHRKQIELSKPIKSVSTREILGTGDPPLGAFSKIHDVVLLDGTGD